MTRGSRAQSFGAGLALRACAVVLFVAALPFAWELVAWDAGHSESARPSFFSLFSSWGLGRIPLLVPVLLLGGAGVTLWQKGTPPPPSAE